MNLCNEISPEGCPWPHGASLAAPEHFYQTEKLFTKPTGCLQTWD